MFSEAVMHNRIDWVKRPPLVDSMSSAARLHMTAPVGGFTMTTEHEEILIAVVRELRRKGQRPETGLLLPSGYPDIVTRRCIYEIKPHLTVPAVQKAIGQLSLYGEDLPRRSLIILGRPGRGLEKFQSHCESLGITLVSYGEDDRILPTPGANPGWASSFQVETGRRESWAQVLGIFTALLLALLGVSYAVDWLRQLLAM